MKQKIYQIIFIILSIIAVILLIFIIKKYGGRQVNEQRNKETLEVFSKINPDENTENENVENGTILKSNSKDGLYIKAKDGVIKVLEIQGENSKKMDINSFLRGNNICEGDILK